MMNIQEKLAALEDIMELDEGTLNPDMKLGDIEEWDSLSAFLLWSYLGTNSIERLVVSRFVLFKQCRICWM